VRLQVVKVAVAVVVVASQEYNHIKVAKHEN
jgi:hypothetical protein